MLKGDPLVSIRCLVYNHEPFLRQCLDGFVMQQTTFPFEAIIHDDASTDGSADIIREYAEKYPDIIKPIYETENQFSKQDGSIRRILNAAMHPASKYIAMCEGDDYWTDPHKLQLQVDFLESHPDYYMTCHAYQFFYQDAKVFKSHAFVEDLPLRVFQGHEYCSPSLDDYWKGTWFTQVLTIVRRKKEYVGIEKRKRYNNLLDFIACYYMMRAGKCALFKDVMGVYRKHGGGVYSGREDSKWMELVMDNYYCLYELEKEVRVLPLLDEDCSDMFLSSIKSKRFIIAMRLLFRHIKRVPIKHSIDCITMILWKSVGSAIRKLKGVQS